MSLKRARVEEAASSWGSSKSLINISGNTFVPQECAAAVRDAGSKLRKLLIEKFCAGEMPAVELANISYLHTESGGTGLEDLALQPGKSSASNAARHVALVLNKDMYKPDLYYVETPMYNKKLCRRVLEKIPIQLPYEAIEKDASNDECASWTPPPSFDSHPVVLRARANGIPERRIIPVALYWDSVKYSTRDSFIAFYFHNMRTNKQYLAFLLRLALSLHETSI